MAEDKKEESLKPRVRVVSVEDVRGDRGKPRTYRVTKAFIDGDGEPQLEARFNVDRKIFDDSAIVPLSRSWFSYLCGKLGEDTKEWRLDQAAFDAFKTPTETKA